MNIFLNLFLTFLKIGAFSFGGGYGMIAVIRESCLANGWLTEEELMNFIAVAESTPGPIAINMATFVGSAEAGFSGALVATLGVILPSFLIILVIASVIKNLLKLKGVQAALTGVRPVIIGLIIATGIIMCMNVMLSASSLSAFKETGISVDVRAIICFLMISAVAGFYKKIKKNGISPIVLILISAVFGIAFYR